MKNYNRPKGWKVPKTAKYQATRALEEVIQKFGNKYTDENDHVLFKDGWNFNRLLDKLKEDAGTSYEGYASPGGLYNLCVEVFGLPRPQDFAYKERLSKEEDLIKLANGIGPRLSRLEQWHAEVLTRAAGPSSTNKRLEAMAEQISHLSDRIEQFERDSQDLTQLVFNVEKIVKQFEEKQPQSLDAEMRETFDRLIDHLKMAHVTDARNLRFKTSVVPITAGK